MSTSGTIGQTVIDTDKLIQKSLRRCGLAPQVITPEIVQTATEDLFMLLMSLSNRGLNLWCIDNELMPLKIGQKLYVLPVGTTDVLNLLHCTPERLDYVETYNANDVTVDFLGATSVVQFGMKFATLPTDSVEFQKSDDGLVWETVQTVSVADLPEVNTYGWYPLEKQVAALHYRIIATDLGFAEDFYLTNQIREINITPFNRDDYASQPNKNFPSATATNYWFEKLVNPQITLWPVPSDDTRYLHLYRYRQIQDIGTLTEQIELPTRWYEAICWHLAARLAFEIPSVEQSRRAEVVQMAGTMTIEVEGGETDNAPTYFAPNIRGYTR